MSEKGDQKKGDQKPKSCRLEASSALAATADAIRPGRNARRRSVSIAAPII